MIHRGELIRRAILESKIPLSEIARKLGKSRRWLYNQFEKTDVSIDVVLAIEKIIRIDLIAQIPELASLGARSNLGTREQDGPFPQQGEEFWKDKYLRLLEEYNRMLKEKNS